MSDGPADDIRAWRRALLGVALVALPLFLLLGPGRIDTLDGQARFDVAVGLVDQGRPEVTDPVLFASPDVRDNGSWHYAGYTAPPSVLGAVAIRLARLVAAPSTDRDALAFLTVSPVLSTVTLLLLLDTLRLLGVRVRDATLTALVTASATLLLPYAGSSFDQSQHLTIAMATIWATTRATLPGAPTLAWLLPGLFVGIGLTWREVHGIWGVGPLIAAMIGATWPERVRRGALLAAGLIPGFAICAGWNLWRTGAVLPSLASEAGLPWFGNPIVGLLGLTVSPGKGILWFSPPILLGVLGLRPLLARNLRVGIAVAALATAHVLVHACFSFFSGDWCWGPRYALVAAGVLMVAAPFSRVAPAFRRCVVIVGMLVQLLALGRDYAVYIYEAGLPANFQYLHPDVYFTRSQLLARPAEIAEMLGTGLPPEVRNFAANTRHDLVTRATWYVAGDRDFINRHAVFWVPVPWPVWMRTLPDSVPLPLPVGGAALALGLLGLGGVLTLRPILEPAGTDRGSGPP